VFGSSLDIDNKVFPYMYDVIENIGIFQLKL